MYLEIEKVVGREILDSRGNPTVELWNSVTEIKRVTLERVCRKQLKISTL